MSHAEQAEEDAQQQRLRESLCQTEKLESLGLMGSGVAHDLNNFIGGILGNLTLAIEELRGMENCQSILESLELVQRTSERAADYSRRVLLFSGRGRPLRQALDFSAVVGEAMKAKHAELTAKGELRHILSANIPPVHAEEAHLRLLVVSLLTNAREAVAHREGAMITLRTGAAHIDPATIQEMFFGTGISSGTYAYLQVSDNGCGIAEDLRNRVFDPFFTTKANHRGLGLALVRGIARAHGGAATFESEPGQFTRLTIVFPVDATPGTVEACLPRGEQPSTAGNP
jgi:signal transduction histidine kinase